MYWQRSPFQAISKRRRWTWTTYGNKTRLQTRGSCQQLFVSGLRFQKWGRHWQDCAKPTLLESLHVSDLALFVCLLLCVFFARVLLSFFCPLGLTKNCKRAIVHQDLSETANVMFAIWMFGAAASSRLSSLWQQCKNSSPTHRMMYCFPGLPLCERSSAQI